MGMQIAYVLCEECEFTVIFKSKNDAFFFCKIDKVGYNIPLENANKPSCPKCKSLMECYSVLEEDNICPVCNNGYLSVMRIKEEELKTPKHQELVNQIFKNKINKDKDGIILKTLKYSAASSLLFFIPILAVIKPEFVQENFIDNFVLITLLVFIVSLIVIVFFKFIKPLGLNRFLINARKPSLIVSFCLLLAVIGYFYWFQWKPSEIRKSCAKEVIEKYSGSNKNNYYRLCVTQKGLKPESIFVK
ncbi:MAG: hypothetical protein HYW86_03870 [Candidatus Roizmanbacteria bacterium]|nr:MAG: hypothetical protein HYW86_03870 [Candidatus Roizmanbacteria bacterium]